VAAAGSFVNFQIRKADHFYRLTVNGGFHTMRVGLGKIQAAAMLENLDLVGHASEEKRFIILQKSPVKAWQVFTEKFADGG